MKQFKFFSMLYVAAGLFFFTACNSSEDKTEPAPVTTGDTSKVKTENPPVPATETVMTIKHKVANFAKWKMAYDSHDSSRQANGMHSYVIARGVEDSNMVMVALKADDVEKAKQWSASPDLKAKMHEGGVKEPVEINYDNVVMDDNTQIPQTIRLMIRHKVKDWDAWKKVFDGDKQARMDAGLTDRALGYSVGDNHSVVIVLAVSDMAKAKAFMNSKALMQKMKDGGVDGTPSFFFYSIAQTY